MYRITLSLTFTLGQKVTGTKSCKIENWNKTNMSSKESIHSPLLTLFRTKVHYKSICFIFGYKQTTHEHVRSQASSELGVTNRIFFYKNFTSLQHPYI